MPLGTSVCLLCNVFSLSPKYISSHIKFLVIFCVLMEIKKGVTLARLKQRSRSNPVRYTDSSQMSYSVVFLSLSKQMPGYFLDHSAATWKLFPAHLSQVLHSVT